MDFQLKQWRDQHESEQEQEHEHEPPSAKQPRLLLNSSNPHQQHYHEYNPSELSLFVPESTNTKLTNMSAYSSDSSSLSATKYPKMGSYFSLVQWQELELQALIFRHMLAGAPIPPELLHLIKKSIITSPYYLTHPLQQFPYYQQSLVQAGYWGKGAMDPEPGRCRRTDGKKWRCSRDVVVGQKYCERHVHRGRNRSRKPVETPTHTNQTDGNSGGGGGGSGGNNSQPLTVIASGGGGGGATHFSVPEASPSIDLLQLSQRTSIPMIVPEDRLGTRRDASDDGKSSGQILRHFFDDWPRSIQENESSVTSSTNLSISTPGNPISDFSLKLSTGDNGSDINVEQDIGQSNWGASASATWSTNQVASMGGPLAEALRSSRSSNSSPTSVLHQRPRGTVSQASYVST